MLSAQGLPVWALGFRHPPQLLILGQSAQGKTGEDVKYRAGEGLAFAPELSYYGEWS